MEELKTTKEKVLEAAAKCSQAKATLEILFPDAFSSGVAFDKDISICINEEIAIQNRLKLCKDYAPNVLWLSEEFNWEIKPVSEGCGSLLIATKL